MHTSLTTPTNRSNLPDTGLPTRPVVYIATHDCSECEALTSAISDAGFRVRSLPLARLSPTLSGGVGPSCLVLDGLPPSPFVAGERHVIPIICLATQGDVAMTVRAMKAGAIDVLARPVATELLVDAVRHALDVSAASLRHAVQHRQLEDCYGALSQREREVMGLVAAGLLNKQVAYKLGISEITVKAHRGRVMRKMDARSLANLVQMANQLRLTPVRHWTS